MKLHLPKRLFTALLTSITLAAAALTLGSAAWGEEKADSTQWVGNDTWYVSDTENALESINAANITNTSVFIRATKDDVVRTVKALTLKSGDTLTIAGDWDSATAHFDALTIDSLIIGSGEQPGSANLTVGAAQNGGTPAQAVTIKSITGSVGNLNLGAASTLTLNDSDAFAAGSVLTLNAGSNLILDNAGDIEFNSHNAGVGITTTGDEGTVTIGSGTTVRLTNTGQSGVAAIDGIIKVLGGGKLLLAGNKSLLGHSNLDDATNAIYLKGDSAESMATMEFATDKAQHFTTNLYLEGYAQITDSTAAGKFAFIECYGGGITATGTQNTIATSLFVNKNATINVIGTNDELTITGRILSDNNDDVLTKSGEGTLTIAGEGLHGVFYNANNCTITESDIRFTFVNSAGTTNINADTAFYKLEVSGGKVNINSDVTVKTTLSAAGSIALDADSTLSLGGGSGTHSIGTLSGSGVVSVNSGESAAAKLSINKLAGYTGSLNAVGYGTNTGTITAHTGGEVRLTGITLDNATATITTNDNSYSTQYLGNVTLSNGATLGISDTSDLNGFQTINISKLDVHGSGDLKTTTATDGWQAQFNISTLTGDTGVDGTLRFSTNSKTTNKTVFNLNGAGDVLFSGNISVGVDNNGDSRKAALNINNASVAQQAIITLESPINCGKPGSVMLGVGLDGATVRGIKDGENPSGGYSGGNRYIDSGQYTVNSDNLINEEVNRTLVIATQNGDDFSSSATIGNYVSLQKDNNGSQTFNGDLSNFNGSIKVTGGTLALESSQAMNNAGNVTVTGGTLHVSNDISTTKLTVANEGIAKFDSTLTADTVQLGETPTITGKQGAAATMSKVQMSSTGISGTAQDGTSIISAAEIEVLAADASFTIADMTLMNTSITAASTKVDLKNIKASNVTLAEGAFTLAASPTLNVGAGGDESGTLTYSTSMGLGSREASLTLNLDVVNAVAGDQHGTYTLVIELTNFNDDAFADVTGDAWGDYVGFQEGSWLAKALNAPAALTEGSTSAPSVSYGFSAGSADSNVGTLVITINGLNVPEPATATLSLLALAALAARRRRK